MIKNTVQQTCNRNLHQIEHSSIPCKFLLPETCKHSRPIKLHNFDHHVHVGCPRKWLCS